METESNIKDLNGMFHPCSIAVVGASTSNIDDSWVKRLLLAGYAGQIYPVNPKATEIAGIKAYPSILDIPEQVDYAIFNVPAHMTIGAMADCVRKGVKFVHCYAAGFSETGLSEGRKMQAQLVKMARDGGIRLLGPNCMGIYCPSSGMSFNRDFPKDKGPVAFVSQSGAESMRFVFLAQDVNLNFSKVVSYGNAADIDAPELLEYLAEDKETKVIASYIEGMKNGPRFVAAIRNCIQKKPVVILKAGLTSSGSGAAASHTASLAGSKTIWEAFFKQTGAIQVYTMDEVADTVQALVRLKSPKGRRVALVGRGGGIGVIASDICERNGLTVPVFHSATRKKLLQIIPEAGAGARNPVETTAGIGGAVDFYRRGLFIVDEDPETDMILIQMAVDVYGGHSSDLPKSLAVTTDALCEVSSAIKKPLAVAFFSGGHADTVMAVLSAKNRLTRLGIPVFTGVESASKSIDKVITFNQLLSAM